jgi:glycosyltransferase involved in cell wall biosynthesis
MRILLVTHYYASHAGGIEIVAGALASRLSHVHDVVWAASDSTPPPAAGGRLGTAPMRTLNTLEHLTGLPFPLWGPGSLARLWRAVGDADVVHLHDAYYFGNWAAFVFARLRGRPVMITQHAGFIRYRRRALRLMLRVLHRAAAPTLLKRADRVAFVSPVVRDYFARFVRFRHPPEIIWNGVDSEIYVPRTPAARQGARARLGLPESAPVVLFVGRFVETKGLATIHDLAARIPDVTWALAGWGPIDPGSWQLPNVRVFSSLRGREIVPLYHAADLLILPSAGEGLPLVVQEAMSCGTPALVDPETARAVDAPAGMLFTCRVTGDDVADAWGAAVTAALVRGDDPAFTDSIAAFARTRWSWHSAVQRYAEIFSELAGPA